MFIDKSTIDVIKKSRKLVTILFTDMVESTRHWERRGDIDARLLIDRHNRLLFPVVRKYNGKIIKTLGDAIMASFKHPENAVQAAIAMQQRLEKERNKDQYFSCRIRIGIHTGTGIVEDHDIFGDVVNVAAKVEAEAVDNQILITASTAARLPSGKYATSEHSTLKPKGKRKPIQLFDCNWLEHKSLLHNIKTNALLPLMRRQKLEISSYLIIGLLALLFIYQKYLRYIFADNNLSLSGLVETQQIPSDYPGLILFIGLAIIVSIIYLLRIDYISKSILKIISGFFGFGIIFLLFHAINSSFEFPFNKRWYNPIYQSEHLFVEVLVDNTQLREKPGISSRIISTLPRGELFIYQDTKNKTDNRRWDKVRLNQHNSAWIARKIPPAFGVAEEQLTRTQKFSFHYYDLYSLILGTIGFIWGFFNFRIRPN